jgi:type IV pilus assembly protein PilF
MRSARLTGFAPLIGICVLLAACTSSGVKDGDATGDLGSARQENESPADLYVKLAVEYLKEGQTETALRKIKKGLDADPKNAQAHNVLALIYHRLGENVLAEKHYKTAVRLQPKDPYVLNAYGSFLCDRRQFAEAETQFNRALANPLYPTPWVAHTNAGICARRANNTSRAETHLRQALAANPSYGPALSAVAEMEYLRGRNKSARSYLDRYFKVARPTPQVLLLGVKVERSLGSRKRANTYAQLLRKSYPDSPEALQL